MCVISEKIGEIATQIVQRVIPSLREIPIPPWPLLPMPMSRFVSGAILWATELWMPRVISAIDVTAVVITIYWLNISGLNRWARNRAITPFMTTIVASVIPTQKTEEAYFLNLLISKMSTCPRANNEITDFLLSTQWYMFKQWAKRRLLDLLCLTLTTSGQSIRCSVAFWPRIFYHVKSWLWMIAPIVKPLKLFSSV